ncbi:PAS domain S-box protein [Salegentibacter sediminis]|uniref:PAS domain S-box protein n=1 Tax=Salegentibacter sediminis TaxID=1930251 RepID=UPI0009C16853|nr:PAS domain S-box protein [Salegentibacter sediminis]
MLKENEKLKILVIEDNYGDFVLIQEYLSDEYSNFKIERAENFRIGRKLLVDHGDFSAVLLDLSLPDVDKPEKLVKEVLELANSSAVIVLTGYADKDFGMKTLSWGVSDYLLKDEITSSILAKSIQYSRERKRVNRQLEESEKKYRNLFDASPLPMWVLDRNTLEFLNVNKAAIDLYGYNRQEFLKMTVRDLWVEGENVGEETWKKNKDTSFSLKIKHRTKEGKLLFMEVETNPISFDGRDARVSLASDITGKMKAEQELYHSQQRFKALVQDGSDMISIIDENYHYSYVSPSVENILDAEPENMEGRNVFDFIHPEDEIRIKKYLKFAGNKKTVQLPSYRYKNGNGNWRWLETIMSDLRDDPAVGGFVANSRDITQFINQEQVLKESLERYDTVAKATSDLILDFDLETDELKFNEAISEIFGYSTDDIALNRKWWESKIHPDDFGRIKAHSREMVERKRKLMHTEYRLACADGSYKYVLDRSYLLTDTSGNPKRIIGSIQDITDRYNYIKAIEDSNERLREIAWTQSHVVRAPLARIMGLIDLLRNNRENIENITEILDNILISSEELDKVIRKIANKTER